MAERPLKVSTFMTFCKILQAGSVSLIFSADSVLVSSFPYSHVLPVEVVPYLLVLYLFGGRLVPHNDYFVILCNVSFRDSSVVQMHLTVHLHILVMQTHQILVVFVSLQRNRTVIVEEQIEQRDVFCFSVILQA
jgi:hypothetical protein